MSTELEVCLNRRISTSDCFSIRGTQLVWDPAQGTFCGGEERVFLGTKCWKIGLVVEPTTNLQNNVHELHNYWKRPATRDSRDETSLLVMWSIMWT